MQVFITLLSFLILVPSLAAASSDTELVWRYNHQAWTAPEGVYSLREAEQRCAAVSVAQTADWHVPSVSELTGAYAAMKSPTRNPVFGEAAGSFREVWTGQANPQSPGTFYFVDFQTGQPGSAGPLDSYRAVCVATDSTGLPPALPTTPVPPAQPPMVTTGLEGLWQMPCDAGTTTALNFVGGRFGIRVVIFYDSQCTQPRLTETAYGRFQLGEPVAVPRGGIKIDYFYESFALTPMTDAEASARDATRYCGVRWVKGQAQETLGIRCDGVTLPVGMGYYSVVRLYGGKLFHGATIPSTDMDGSSDARRPRNWATKSMVRVP